MAEARGEAATSATMTPENFIFAFVVFCCFRLLVSYQKKGMS
jgi:hypothetical protein